MKKTLFILLLFLPLISNAQSKTKLDTTKVISGNVQTDRLPEFPGGEKKLFKFMSTYLEYPIDARNNKVQGTVIVKFVVTEIGKLDSIEVYRGVRPDLNKAAIDLVKQMPNWIPGIENGKPTRVRFSLPITFRCQ